ncbi:MAG: hypothetical protein HRK26_00490 [Rickettsiaceae bacterium H1]|nr:hypothetical protein [Rickettsiaceae bacterium H1]
MVSRLTKRHIFILIYITIGFTVHYALLNHNVKNLINRETANISKNISKNLQRAKQNDCPILEDSAILKLSLKEAINSEKPFISLLANLNMENDQYLLEIAESGIITAKNLQREFFMSVLPKLQEISLKPINNKFIARWVKIRKKDVNMEDQIALLTQQISLQNFDKAVQIIDELAVNLQQKMQSWRKKLMDYIYVYESLEIEKL